MLTEEFPPIRFVIHVTKVTESTSRVLLLARVLTFSLKNTDHLCLIMLKLLYTTLRTPSVPKDL